MSSLDKEPSKDSSYQISIHLVKRFQRRFFRNQSIKNKNCMWRPCLLTDQDEMSILYREPSIDASYQVLVHLAKQFPRRRYFRNQPTRNKNCLSQVAMFANGSVQNEQALYRTFHRCFLLSLGLFGKAVSEEKNF
jgi:hypothetical protein